MWALLRWRDSLVFGMVYGEFWLIGERGFYKIFFSFIWSLFSWFYKLFYFFLVYRFILGKFNF